MRKGVDLTVPNDKLFTCMVCIWNYNDFFDNNCFWSW